jgi:hypothetical protein
MSDDGRLDLSGDWAGTYSYPGLLKPVSFTAKLSEQGGWLSGMMEEKSVMGRGPARLRAASVQGRRVGLAVTWMKMYEDREVNHDVEYEGAVDADGDEITGRWSIFGNWSGSFVMVRRSRKALARERTADVDVGA